MIGENVLKTLEYDKILQSVAHFAASSASYEAVLQMRPQTDFSAAEKSLRLTGEAWSVLYRHMENPIHSFDACGDIFDKLKVLSVLTFSELLRMARILRSSRLCKSCLSAQPEGEALLLKEEALRIIPHQDLEKQIFDCILSEDEMSDYASDQLYQLRTKIRKCNQDIKDKLDSLIRSNGYQKYLQDAIVTMRAGRYVIPVKQECRGNVSGLIHDQSSTKSTVFMEPMQVVELNNELRSLEILEQEEVERILLFFTGALSAVAEEIKAGYETMIGLDVVFCKAQYAGKTKAALPLLNNEGRVRLKRARHPLILADRVVPIDVELGDKFDILIITGPNTGGKTVSIKTAGLFSLMAMSGMYLPAEEESEISFFDGIYCDIGDEQSIENSLSTFSSHLTHITEICNCATNRSLILLDEVGAGTDPDEGAALATAIVDYLRRLGAKVIATTHYGALKEYSVQQERVENASMEFDPMTFAPSYRLKIGMPGSSRALEIALRLGLKQEIVTDAKRRIAPEKLALEKVLTDADRILAETSREKEEIDRMHAELAVKLSAAEAEKEELAKNREKLLTAAKAEARRVVAENTAEAEQILAELKRMMNAPQVGGGEYLAGSKLKKQLESKMDRLAQQEEKKRDVSGLAPFHLEKAEKGQSIFVKSIGVAGTLEDVRIKNEKLSVRIGSIKMDVPVSDLAIVRGKANQKRQEPVQHVFVRAGGGPVRTEINLLGQTVFEAEQNVEEFLENAAACNLLEVKIIHGIGTGKLREGIHALLKGHPLVEEFRLGRYGEGEGGVTLVKLK